MRRTGPAAFRTGVARLFRDATAGWPAAVLAEPVPPIAPTAFAVMAAVSLPTRRRVPHALRRLHLPEKALAP
ncbi:hypothetical protein ABZ806_10895 [Spirillospora sp. NPDC047418]